MEQTTHLVSHHAAGSHHPSIASVEDLLRFLVGDVGRDGGRDDDGVRDPLLLDLEVFDREYLLDLLDASESSSRRGRPTGGSDLVRLDLSALSSRAGDLGVSSYWTKSTCVTSCRSVCQSWKIPEIPFCLIPAFMLLNSDRMLSAMLGGPA